MGDSSPAPEATGLTQEHDAVAAVVVPRDESVSAPNTAGPPTIEPTVTKAHLDYMEMIFRRCIAAIMGSRDVSVNGAVFDHILWLAEQRIAELVTSLVGYAAEQRRTQPSLEDLSLLLTLHDINPFELDAERELSSRYVSSLNALRFDPELEPVLAAAAPFFDSQVLQVQKIVPARETLPSYAPAWMPPLPPDHTYRATPKYNNKVTDLRHLRERLVVEGRTVERALQRLTGSNSSTSAVDLTTPSRSRAIHELNPQGQLNLPAQPVNGVIAGDGDLSMEDADIERNSYITIVENSRPQDGNDYADPADLATNGSAGAESAAIGQSYEGGDEGDNKLPALKFKLNPSRPKQGPAAASKPLSFKITLGKKSEESRSGESRRPKIDIEALARRRRLGGSATGIEEESQSPGPSYSNGVPRPSGARQDSPPLSRQFDAALQSLLSTNS